MNAVISAQSRVRVYTECVLVNAVAGEVAGLVDLSDISKSFAIEEELQNSEEASNSGSVPCALSFRSSKSTRAAEGEISAGANRNFSAAERFFCEGVVTKHSHPSTGSKMVQTHGPKGEMKTGVPVIENCRGIVALQLRTGAKLQSRVGSILADSKSFAGTGLSKQALDSHSP